MSEISIFENKDFGKLRIIDLEGRPWFIATDVATSLGYKDTGKAVRKLCKDIRKFQAPKAISAVNVISEPDVYRLILKSALPTAEKFQDWVVEVVLPSIRKTGAYSPVEFTNGQPANKISLENLANEFSAAKRLALDMNLIGPDAVITANHIVFKVTGIDALKLADHAPIASTAHGSATVLGKKYLGGLSPQEVNKLLCAKGLQERKGGVWHPTKEGSKYVIYTTVKPKNGKAYCNQRTWSVSVVDLLRPAIAA